ncbi:MAG: BlaI/MecI/CopY family transcriptional regulator [Oscillospiraceae bacterium]|jgi:BlaI family penicillinase repressor|nr:BlaI/MecI/CopY family transcriptional regulator [Oscillospiraceae bacterium]
MPNLAARITNSELEIMKILWREGVAVSFTELRLELQRSTEWDKSTINTLIRRLTDKGVITAERRGIARYTPNVSRADYARFEQQSLLDKLYGGSAKQLAAALVSGGKLSEADIDELKAYFKVEDSDNDNADV